MGERVALHHLDGAPQVRPGTTDEFFDCVEAEISAGAAVPVWNGELYFEMHRGTLTSQAKTKVGNRRCEGLLREAELWWATATSVVPAEVTAELEELWKEVLLQQFHDIIPGSSITWVYEDSEAAHARVAARAEALIAQALALVAPSAPSLANAGSVARAEVVALAPTFALGDGQQLHDGSVAAFVSVPAFGVAPLASTSNTSMASRVPWPVTYRR